VRVLVDAGLRDGISTMGREAKGATYVSCGPLLHPAKKWVASAEWQFIHGAGRSRLLLCARTDVPPDDLERGQADAHRRPALACRELAAVEEDDGGVRDARHAGRRARAA
jgi:hypothetical protein